jgi:hypothetical protein
VGGGTGLHPLTYGRTVVSHWTSGGTREYPWQYEVSRPPTHGDISRHVGSPIYCSLVARYTSVSYSNITVVESKLVNGHGGLSILLLRSEGPKEADCNRDCMLLLYQMQGFFRYKVRYGECNAWKEKQVR